MELTNQSKKERRKPSVDIANAIYGKVPPQACELEEAVLGAIMIEKQAFDIANDILTPESFYKEAHQRIFKAMCSMAGKHQQIDLITLAHELKLNEDLELIGGPYFLSKLTTSVVSSASIETHSRIVLQKYLMRELIRVNCEVLNMAYEDSSDVFDVLDFAEENVSGLRMNNVRKSFKTLQKIIGGNLKAIEELRFKDEDITGVPSGFADLDNVTCGWQNTDLIILAARPSVGKTAFALTLAKNAATHFRDGWLNATTKLQIPVKQKAVGFFSLEMADRQLVNRVLSSESGVWMWRLKNGKMDDDQMRSLYDSAERLNNILVFIDDTPALKIQEFKSKARVMVRKHNVGIIFLDYLQLAKDPAKKMREQEIASISGSLKEMAKELEIPIIALSQMNRDFGKEGSREPQLSDLRESGAIEQDADLVMFLFKPGQEEIIEGGNSEEYFYTKIAKFRNGSSPVKFLGKFKGETQKHEWLKIVDNKTLKPIGETWTPAGGTFKQPALDFTQSKSERKHDEEAPF